MGVLDKIKNALFEVEYVEVEEPPKKEKKVKTKNVEKEKDVSDKPIAKKIVLPGKKEDKVEEIKEEELAYDDVEEKSTVEASSNNNDSFKFMDDDDFSVDDNVSNEEPEIVKVIEEDKRASRREQRLENDYKREEEIHRKENERRFEEAQKAYKEYEDAKDNYYNNKASYERESRPYGMDSSYKVQVHEYGTYDKRDDKLNFKPSPIISPIYGILDKNYKKEDVVAKKEVRVVSSYSRSNVSVDDIRNKAYGEKDEVVVNDNSSFVVEEDDDDNLLVDLSDDKDRPEVKELTMGDAMEYFQDLGLEYNVDYVDASKEKTTGRREKDNYDDIVDTSSDDSIVNTPVKEDVIVDNNSNNEDDMNVSTKMNSVVEIKNESKDDNLSFDDDDNLFDLIDSMYQDNN